MLRRGRTVLFALAFALAGAVAGRLVSTYREELEAATERDQVRALRPPRLDIMQLRLRPRDVLPGLVAAMRAGEAPWSYLHIPGWLAAFAVNFGFGAFGKELAPLRRMVGFPDFGLFGDDDDDAIEASAQPSSAPASNPAPMPVWTAESGASREAGTPERPGNGQQGAGFTAFPN